MTAAAVAARARAALALVTIALILAAGLLARKHEAEVSHFTDARTGITSHGLDTECHEATIVVSHVHALPGDGHAEACNQLAALHQPVVFAPAAPVVTPAVVAERALAPPVVADVHPSVLRSAPKTSPPARA